MSEPEERNRHSSEGEQWELAPERYDVAYPPSLNPPPPARVVSWGPQPAPPAQVQQTPSVARRARRSRPPPAPPGVQQAPPIAPPVRPPPAPPAEAQPPIARPVQLPPTPPAEAQQDPSIARPARPNVVADVHPTHSYTTPVAPTSPARAATSQDVSIPGKGVYERVPNAPYSTDSLGERQHTKRPRPPLTRSYHSLKPPFIPTVKLPPPKKALTTPSSCQLPSTFAPPTHPIPAPIPALEDPIPYRLPPPPYRAIEALRANLIPSQISRIPGPVHATQSKVGVVGRNIEFPVNNDRSNGHIDFGAERADQVEHGYHVIVSALPLRRFGEPREVRYIIAKSDRSVNKYEYTFETTQHARVQVLASNQTIDIYHAQHVRIEAQPRHHNGTYQLSLDITTPGQQSNFEITTTIPRSNSPNSDLTSLGPIYPCSRRPHQSESALNGFRPGAGNPSFGDDPRSHRISQLPLRRDGPTGYQDSRGRASRRDMDEKQTYPSAAISSANWRKQEMVKPRQPPDKNDNSHRSEFGRRITYHQEVNDQDEVESVEWDIS